MNTGSRPMGVQPTSMEDKRAPAKKVQHFARMEMFAMEMGDEQGRKVVTTVFRMNGVWYHDPNAPRWAENLREMDKNNWLHKELEAAYSSLEGAESGDVPRNDAVRVGPR